MKYRGVEIGKHINPVAYRSTNSKIAYCRYFTEEAVDNNKNG